MMTLRVPWIAVSCGHPPVRCAVGAHNQTCNCCGTASRMRLEMKYFLWHTSRCMLTRLSCHLTLHWLFIWESSSLFPFLFSATFCSICLQLPFFGFPDYHLEKNSWLPLPATSFAPPVTTNIWAIVLADIYLHQAKIQNFPAIDMRFHGTLNMRDLSNGFQVYIISVSCTWQHSVIADLYNLMMDVGLWTGEEQMLFVQSRR